MTASLSRRSRRSTGAALLAIGISAVVALSACTPVSSVSNDDDDEVGETIRIGFLGALSGPSATYGVRGQQGAQLAIDQLNEAGELPWTLELVALDDKADPATSATLASQLVNEENVVAVIGGPNSGTVKANNPVITEAGVVELISIAQEDSLVDPALPSFPLTFRMTERNSYDITANVALLEAQDYENLCVVTDTSAYGQGGLTSIRAVFEAKGLTVHEAVEHEPAATDLTSQALKLRDAGCDAVYLFDLGADAALFLKTVKQLDWDVDVIGARGLATSSFISTAGSDGDGIAFVSTLDPSRPAALDYIEAYDEAYGEDDDPAHVFSSLGYDAVLLLAAGLQASDGKGGTDLAEALESLEFCDGATGREGTCLSFSPDDHEATGPNYVTFWALEDGKPTFLTDDFEVDID